MNPLAPPRSLRRCIALAAAGLLFGCASSTAREAGSPGGNPAPEPRLAAPWSEPALAAASVPAIYAQVWRTAENRAGCALIAPERLDPALERTATPRAATFSGGWAVAYDLPELRSAFGVAGTGSDASAPDLYDEWPHKRIFADGSRVGYGPEGGGAGPNWLAYIRIPDQRCLYNVWSRRGQAHLEELLGQLRFVTTP